MVIYGGICARHNRLDLLMFYNSKHHRYFGWESDQWSIKSCFNDACIINLTRFGAHFKFNCSENGLEKKDICQETDVVQNSIRVSPQMRKNLIYEVKQISYTTFNIIYDVIWNSLFFNNSRTRKTTTTAKMYDKLLDYKLSIYVR